MVFVAGDLPRALSYLQSGLSLSDSLSRKEESARLRHRLGLVHWEAGEATIAVEQLEKAAGLFESLNAGGCIGAAVLPGYGQQPNRAELLSQTYRLLQKILVSLDRNEEALNWAERSRRTKETGIEDAMHYSEIVDRQRGIVLYYSEVDGEVHSWCLAPGRGLLRFHSSSLADGPSLENRVLEAREALLLGESATDLALLDDNCPAKIPSRGHHLNASSYSLSSLFSVGSLSSRAGSARWAQQRGGPVWQAPPALQGLYDLLLAPFEDLLPMPRKELIMVVEESLYLAPLPALQSGPGQFHFYLEYQCIWVEYL